MSFASNTESMPVFIVGMNGSGTTMLADSLGRHSQLYMFPRESRVIPFFLERLDEFGNLDMLANRRKLADEIGKTYQFWLHNDRDNVRLSDDELSMPGFSGVLGGLYKHFAIREGKDRWGDKSPINTQHIKSLAKNVEGSQFIHIIRDGRDAAQSFHRRWGYSPMHTIWRWRKMVSAARRAGLELPAERYLEVHYESLTDQPAKEMERICDFLGLGFEPAVTDSSMRMMDEENPDATSGTIVRNSEKWRRYFSTGQIRKLERIAGSLLEELGYSVDTAGSQEPSAMRRNWWKIRDGLAWVIWWFTKRPYPRSMKFFIGTMSSKLKQWRASRF